MGEARSPPAGPVVVPLRLSPAGSNHPTRRPKQTLSVLLVTLFSQKSIPDRHPGTSSQVAMGLDSLGYLNRGQVILLSPAKKKTFISRASVNSNRESSPARSILGYASWTSDMGHPCLTPEPTGITSERTPFINCQPIPRVLDPLTTRQQQTVLSQPYLHIVVWQPLARRPGALAATWAGSQTGTFAIVSLMTGGVVERFASNVTAIDPQELESQKISIATTLAVLSGAIQLIMFSLQLGFVAIYLSDPLVSAFTNAAAIHVLVSQIKNMLGLQVPRFSGPASIFMTMVDIFQKLPNTNIAELVTSLVCLTVLIPVREINQRYKSKLKAPIPVELLLIVLATVISFYARLEEKFGVTVVGNIPAGLPVPQLPTVTNFSSLIADGLAIAIVGYAVSVSLAKIFAKKHGYTVDANQELFAHGVCNLFGSFFQCFPSAASISRTSIQEGTGGNTQLASGISTMVVLVVLLAVGPLFRALQRSVLACIIVVGLKRMLMHFTDLKQLWKISKVDFYIWLVTWLAVLLLNVDLGLGVAVAFSLLTIVYRTQRPDCKLLGRIPDTELYRPLDEFAKCEEIAGVKVIAYSSSLYYGNHDHFKTQVFSLVGLDPGLEKAAREKAKKRANVTGSGRQVGSAPSAQNCSPRDGDSHFAMNNPSFTAEGTSPQGQAGGALSACGSAPVAQTESGPPLQAIVLDCSGFNFMDSVGALSLMQVCEDFRDIGTRVLLARCSEEIQGTLEKSGFYKKFSEDVIFATLHDAVASITPTTMQRAAPVSWHHEDVTVF
ncbi:prestin-like [Petromyzon marinus]|uniref:prestin-like n=1 Tax=Petromyzon marinus TaxID=7757 RepID=UPI003F717B4C